MGLYGNSLWSCVTTVFGEIKQTTGNSKISAANISRTVCIACISCRMPLLPLKYCRISIGVICHFDNGRWSVIQLIQSRMTLWYGLPLVVPYWTGHACTISRPWNDTDLKSSVAHILFPYQKPWFWLNCFRIFRFGPGYSGLGTRMVIYPMTDISD